MRPSMGRIRPTVLVACEMCARIWGPFEEKGVCEMSYVGYQHMWKRYPDDDELVLRACATDLLEYRGSGGARAQLLSNISYVVVSYPIDNKSLENVDIAMVFTLQLHLTSFIHDFHI